MLDPFEIIVGTYEQFLLGYKVTKVGNEYKMEKTFATHSHVGSIRSVASSKHYLASGGADDSVFLYDLRYRVESGRLMHHNDTVNCIAFTPEASHLFTCSNDGTIAAVHCGNWQMEKHWLKPHKGLAVNALAIHPTGKVAMSTGADGILRTWNLVKGRQAYATNLVPRLKLDAKNVTIIKWSPNGEKYLLAVNHRIDVYSVELAGINSEIQFDSKIVCVEFLEDDLIAVGLENGQIKLYDLEKSVETVEAVAHNIRVKCIAFKDNLLVTASSTGEIKLWRFTKYKLRMMQKVNCGTRITCLSLAIPYVTRTAEECDVGRVRRVPSTSRKERTNTVDGIHVQIEEEEEVRVEEELKKNRKEDDLISDGIPQKKQKLLKKMQWHVEDVSDVHTENFKNNNTSKKERIGAISSVQENHDTPSKKVKKPSKQISALGNIPSKESTANNAKVSLEKRKKEAGVKEAAGIIRKKKKKQ